MKYAAWNDKAAHCKYFKIGLSTNRSNKEWLKMKVQFCSGLAIPHAKEYVSSMSSTFLQSMENHSSLAVWKCSVYAIRPSIEQVISKVSWCETASS